MDTLSEIVSEMNCFVRHAYPDFVTSSSPNARLSEIPIFVFHTINPQSFELQLSYLQCNGYRTINADELYAYLTNDIPIPPKTILLAFDDGRRSVWEYGYPLLLKYGFTAVVFIIPGYTVEQTVICPTSEPINGEALLSWEEIEIMHKSGLVDIQSHSLYHHKVFTSDRLIGFLDEDTIQPIYDQVMPYGFEPEYLASPPECFFGMPIYESASLMEGKGYYVGDVQLQSSCIRFYQEHVKGNGSVKSRRKEMMRFAKHHKMQRNGSSYYSTAQDTSLAILKDLSLSKEMIENRLGKPVNHLCYPNCLYSELSTKLSMEAGYLTNFCGCIPGKPANKKGDNPYRCVRLKNDFIFRLPGEGRVSLLSIIESKIKRRLKGDKGF